jgi:hypothetical protein
LHFLEVMQVRLALLGIALVVAAALLAPALAAAG